MKGGDGKKGSFIHFLLTNRKRKVEDPELSRKMDDLESMYLEKDTVSEKEIHQQVMSYLRQQKEHGIASVNATYPVYSPFSFINIRFDEREQELEYIVQEPTLSDEDVEKLHEVKEFLDIMMNREELPITEKTVIGKSNELREYLLSKYLEVIKTFSIEVDEKKRSVLFYYIERDLLGFGKADPIMRDNYIEDVSCNGANLPMFVYHRVFGSMRTNILFPSELDLAKYVIKLAQLAGKHISVYQPILDASLHDGSRMNLTLGTEVTKKGSTFTIRKFSEEPISPIDLMRFGSIDSQQLAYFWHLIQYKKSFLISGGTASGKTTLLNALCNFIRPEDKIVSIEDTPEINVEHKNWIQSIARKGYGAGASGVSGVSGISGGGGGGGGSGSIDLFDLLVAALRQRPEYVIVGEVRGREAFTLFQAIAVGHASMSTVHAGNINELLHRIENEPMNIPRVLLPSLDAVAFQGQVITKDKKVRRVKAVTEVLEVERVSENLITNETFTWMPDVDDFSYCGRSYILEDIAKETGKPVSEIKREVERKREYIDIMDEMDVTYFRDVKRAINAFYNDPDNAVDILRDGK